MENVQLMVIYWDITEIDHSVIYRRSVSVIIAISIWNHIWVISSHVESLPPIQQEIHSNLEPSLLVAFCKVHSWAALLLLLLSCSPRRWRWRWRTIQLNHSRNCAYYNHSLPPVLQLDNRSTPRSTRNHDNHLLLSLLPQFLLLHLPRFHHLHSSIGVDPAMQIKDLLYKTPFAGPVIEKLYLWIWIGHNHMEFTTWMPHIR